jgi:hypothetical protein
MNPFKDAKKRAQYQSLMVGYASRNKMLFNADGTQNRNNSFAAHFWAGYNGIEGVLFNPYNSQYRNTGGYVFYRAGADCRKNIEKVSENA